MLRKFFATGITMTAFYMGFTQDSTEAPSALSITGSADLYYRYDFAKTKANNLTSFTNSHNRFELGMASVKLQHKTSKVDVVADLGFGKRAQDFSYNDQGILAAIKQMYISYMPTSSLKFTAGSWATHVGYELVDAYLNRNYSMSYMFTNGPFFHTGVKAEFAVKSSGFMIGIANPTDFKYVPDGSNNKKSFIAQYSFAPGDFFKAYLNYAGGQGMDSSKSKQFDLVVTSKLAEKFSIGFNGTYNNTEMYLGNKTYDDSKNWWGSALYLNFDPSAHAGITIRGEYFSDKSALKIPLFSPVGGGSIFATTISAQLKVDNFIFIPELRFDNANQAIFTKEDGSATKNAANVLLAAIYYF